MKRLYAILFSFFICSFSIHAAEAVSLPATEVAVLAESVVVAHVGSTSNDGNWAALWVDRVLKGRLRGGLDIVWVNRKEFPKPSSDAKEFLIFMTSHGDGSWHVQTGNNSANIIPLENVQSPKLAEITKAIGSYGPAPAREFADGEIDTLVRKAARGSQESRLDAKLKLLSGGDGVRQYLSSQTASGEHEISTLARTLLPLFAGGAAISDVRMSLDAPQVMTPGDLRNLSVNFANLSADDMKIVTGQSSWGETVLAAAAYEIRPLASGDKKAPSEKLPATMPAEYGKPREGGSPPMPLIQIAPSMGILPIAVGIELERAVVDGKESLRLKFPHGQIALPGPGKYALRVRFSCPGPRPDQKRLIDQHYWGGGQLVSNEVVFVVK